MAVYADSPAKTPVTEEHPLDPASPYGINKLAAERSVMLLGRQLGVEPVALRYFNTFGPRQTFTPYVGVVTIFATKLLAGDDLTVFGDGSQTRDFVHVTDVARANLLALTAPAAAHRTLNVGSGRGTTVLALAAMLRARLRPDAAVHHEPARAEELTHSVADISAARGALGYEPETDLEGQLDDVIESLRKVRTA